MKVLVDTNVLLDVGMQRTGFVEDSTGVLSWCEEHPGNGFIAWHSLSNVFYIMRKPCGAEATREFVAVLLDLFEIPPSGTAAAQLAFRLPMDDFEDALQVAAAIEAGADVIVTRDAEDYGNSPIPILAPRAFLASLPT